MFNNPITFSDPEGDLPPLAILGIGAAVGVFSNGLSNVSQGQGFFDGAGKGALWGGIGAAASLGIGSIFGSTGSAMNELGRAGAHALSGGIQSHLQGGSFGQGLLSGGMSSIVGTTLSGTGTGVQIFGSSIGGGIGSLASGGNFFTGFGQGVAVGAFNHGLHSEATGVFGDPPKKGDTKLSGGSWGGVLEYDGSNWVPNGDFVMASGQINVTAAPWEYVIGGGILKDGVGVFKMATGGLKQWVRIGNSFSRSRGVNTVGVRWGAGGKHWKKIGNLWLRNFNKTFRQTKLPFGGWRSADKGHFHFWTKKS